MTLEFFLDNWLKISAVLLSLSTVIVSPVVIIRYLKTKNELREVQTFVKKNQVIREEIAAITAEIQKHQLEINDLKKKLLMTELENIRLKEENDLLKQKVEK